MNRPKFWYHLPYCVREHIASNCDLDYDPYESSKAEALDSVLCNPEFYSRNNKLIQHYYDGMSDETLFTICRNNLNNLKSQVDELTKFMS